MAKAQAYFGDDRRCGLFLIKMNKMVPPVLFPVEAFFNGIFFQCVLLGGL